MIDIETLLDGLLIVVAASGLLAAKQETLHQLILWYEQLDHSCHLMAALGKHLLQSLSLRDGAGEAIKDDTLVVGTKAVIDAGEDIDHQFVGNQLTLVDIALGRLAKFRSVLISLRNTSPVEMWPRPYFSISLSLCVPLPAPGAPKLRYSSYINKCAQS